MNKWLGISESVSPTHQLTSGIPKQIDNSSKTIFHNNQSPTHHLKSAIFSAKESFLQEADEGLEQSVDLSRSAHMMRKWRRVARQSTPMEDLPVDES